MDEEEAMDADEDEDELNQLENVSHGLGIHH